MEETGVEVDPKLLACLVCPVTRGPLDYDRERHVLVSVQARLVFPVRNGAPIMLTSEASALEDHPSDDKIGAAAQALAANSEQNLAAAPGTPAPDDAPD